jgi:hypothetical protein
MGFGLSFGFEFALKHSGASRIRRTSLIRCRIPLFANNASSGYFVAPQTQNLFYPRQTEAERSSASLF